MGGTGGSSGKTTSRKRTMALLQVEAVCVLPKTEPGHLLIRLSHTSLG